jgi:carbonic anhydrase
MGHGRCGAVTAAIQGQSVPGQIGSLFPYIESAVQQAGPDLEATIRANALIQANAVRSSPLLAGLIEEGKLKVSAAYFDIASGTVTLLESPTP